MNRSALITAVRTSVGRERVEPFLVPGTLLVAYLLATGRWGSYVGWPSHMIYVSDVLLASTFAWTLLRRGRLALRPRRAVTCLAPVIALLAVASLRFLFGDDLSRTALRDLAPYAYALTALLALVNVNEKARHRTTLVVAGALMVHAAWVSVSILDASIPARLPLVGGRVHVLEIRPDFDGAVLAILVGLATHMSLTARSGRPRLLAAGLTLWSSWLVLQLANRAALLALAISLVLVALLSVSRIRTFPRRTTAAIGLAVVLVAVVLTPSSSLYRRLAGAPEFASNSAAATQQARLWAWQDVLDYMDDSPSRVALGTGFGPDFVWISGASIRLEGPGDSGVRAPHSYLLNTYARLGALGTGLLLWLITSSTLAGRRVLRHRPTHPSHVLLVVLICATLLGTSLVGVILESPFGAIPFFWATGLLLVGGQRRSASPDAAGPVTDELRGRPHGYPAAIGR